MYFILMVTNTLHISVYICTITKLIHFLDLKEVYILLTLFPNHHKVSKIKAEH